MKIIQYICGRKPEFTINSNHNLTNKYSIMNKTQLVEKIAAGAGIPKTEAKKAIEATVAALKEALVAGEKVQLIGFGTFSVKERPAHAGVNPRTGEKKDIPAKKVAKFKAGAELAAAL